MRHHNFGMYVILSTLWWQTRRCGSATLTSGALFSPLLKRYSHVYHGKTIARGSGGHPDAFIKFRVRATLDDERWWMNGSIKSSSYLPQRASRPSHLSMWDPWKPKTTAAHVSLIWNRIIIRKLATFLKPWRLFQCMFSSLCLLIVWLMVQVRSFCVQDSRSVCDDLIALVQRQQSSPCAT